MNEANSSYKDSLKATTLFGGVQIYNIIIQVIKSKIVAILLGPTGMGIVGLLSSTTTIISTISNCGLGTSAVRKVAESYATNNTPKISLIITVFRKLVWITGILGALICIIFSQFWSRITFGNTDYTFAFIILSLNILLMQLTTGHNVLLQGLRKYRYLAKANIIGNTIGLVITIPLYYFWGIKAIVPVLVISNFSAFFIASYFSSKINISSIKINFNDIKNEGSDIVRMGLLLGFQGGFSALAAYLIQIFITNTGGVSDVGLYNAGFTIVNTYVGLVFTAMGTDYYPRLSAISSDNTKFIKSVNQQAEISLLLLTPIVLIFIVFIKWIIVLLYSEKFIPAQGMIYWAISAILFKAMAWSLSYSILAKGNTKIFFWNESITITYGLGFNLLGYSLFGLTGLGISFFIVNLLYFFQLWLVTKKYFNFVFEVKILKQFIFLQAATLICLLITILASMTTSIIIGTVLILITIFYSFIELDKRIEIRKNLTHWFKHK